jgi:A/G-specific adenine glycosylase
MKSVKIDRINIIYRMKRREKTPATLSKTNFVNPVNSVKAPALVQSLLSWFAKNARDLPWRRTHDPYAIWVSEIMLQQTQVKTVIPFWERWMREMPAIDVLANAPSEKIHKLWEGLGYYTRVRNLQKAAQHIVQNHSGKFPTNFNDVLALPGIGPYTAGAICSIAFNQPTPIVDGNVIRVLTRVFGIRAEVRDKEVNARLWELAQLFVNTAQSKGSPVTRHDTMQFGACSALNQSLMELGATVCTPAQPRCTECPVNRRCLARKLALIESIPNLGKRVAPTQRRFIACVVERNGHILVRQRPAGVVNAHLWEFPNTEVSLKSLPPKCRAQIESELGCVLEHFTPLTEVKHSITRYRISLQAFSGTLNGAMPRSEVGQWFSHAELEKLPFTSAHRRVLQAARQIAASTS